MVLGRVLTTKLDAAGVWPFDGQVAGRRGKDSGQPGRGCQRYAQPPAYSSLIEYVLCDQASTNVRIQLQIS